MCPPENVPLILNSQNFAKAKNLLGQEFSAILFDARTTLNLDALAIAIGTLRTGGTLVLWLNPNQHIDLDSRRWSGVANGILTPNFNQHFYSLLSSFFINRRGGSMYPPENYAPFSKGGYIDPPLHQKQNSTAEQQRIIQQILRLSTDIAILTAKRGRGKSALLGMLANQLNTQKCWQKCWLTAPNKSAVQTLQDFAEQPIDFIAPDELTQQIQQAPTQFKQDWLLIDEAAMLPLPILNQFIRTFKRIVISTTIHSYEGTGRGFLLKFLTNLPRTFQQFELTEPLRWAKNDKLEVFIDELLLLEAEDRLVQPDYDPQTAVQIRQVSQQTIVEKINDFYALLTLAHYRTSPLDLRRLFDAPQQRFYLAESGSFLLGGVWLMEEGGLTSLDLIEKICRGERRPQGNLVAQALAFQGNLPQACALKSLRISRIAVQPNWQNHGLGQKLINTLIQQAEVDFLSVSFGYTAELYAFWQKCGFILVQISEYQEASSGCYSVIMLCPISIAGEKLVAQAQRHFQRNFSFSFHPLKAQFPFPLDWQLTDEDFQILQNVAFFHRTLFASIGAIRRLMATSDRQCCPLLTAYCQGKNIDKTLVGGKKHWLTQCRLEVASSLDQIM
ncbi:tRNA(Met) cytidine acetyltransferase TmcA [Lonepinella sp. BR2271]|uniref:tRNA(Met) cytidine acetyltransferase TmcA n=1 Tax=Lonepinella sp. BR2271 TaxID=3434550 RepID=UPI003F6DAC75